MACLAWHSALATPGSLVRPNRLDLEIKKTGRISFKISLVIRINKNEKKIPLPPASVLVEEVRHFWRKQS